MGSLLRAKQFIFLGNDFPGDFNSSIWQFGIPSLNFSLTTSQLGEAWLSFFFSEFRGRNVGEAMENATLGRIFTLRSISSLRLQKCYFYVPILKFSSRFFFCVKPSTSPFLHPSVFQNQFFCNWTVLHGEKGSNRVPGRPTFSRGNRCCWMGVGNVEVG